MTIKLSNYGGGMMSKKDKIRNICNLILGMLFVLTTILGYYKDVSYMSEYCFISGIIVGLILISSYVCNKNKICFPEWIYANCVVTTIVIFIATIIVNLSLEGAFWFIHIINPVLLFLYWCIFCDHTKIKNQLLIATNLIYPICYIIFAQAIFSITKKCPFPAKLILVGNSWYIIAYYIIGICFVFLLLGYGLHFSNKFIRKILKK